MIWAAINDTPYYSLWFRGSRATTISSIMVFYYTVSYTDTFYSPNYSNTSVSYVSIYQNLNRELEKLEMLIILFYPMLIA
jgi:hypothetical protein